MNEATRLAVTQRLEDKAERDPNVLRDHLSEDDAADVAIASFVLERQLVSPEAYVSAQDTVRRVWNTCLQEYIGANFQSELAEFIAEMADQEREAKRDALMEAQQ